MIYEWTLDRQSHNLGDHCAHIIKNIFESHALQKIERDTQNLYLLLGSAFGEHHLQTLESDSGMKLTLLGCGWRGEVLTKDLLSKCSFYGVRGEYTQAMFCFAELISLHPEVKDPVLLLRLLSKISLRDDYLSRLPTVISDPALLLRLLIKKPRPTGHVVLVPHINDPARSLYKAQDYACDYVINPMTRSVTELEAVVKQIAGAKFVLAGAMHAAIIAYAFGVPFAYFKTEYKDCPPKWDDWNSSIGLSNADFLTNATDGRLWFDRIKPQLTYRGVLPILWEAQKIGAIRKEIWQRAFFADLFKTYKY